MDSSQHKGSEIPRLIWIIGSPIIFTVGVLGNTLTISVLSRTNYKKSSTSVFLMFLAVADMLIVTTILPRWWIIYMFDTDIRHVNNVLCKLHWFFTYFNGCFSNSILVAVTIERIFSILKPYKVKAWCTVNSAVVISITIIITLIAFHGHILHGLKLFSVTEYQFENIGFNNTVRCREEEAHLMHGNSSDFDTDTLELGNENKTTPITCNITNQAAFGTGNGTSTRLLNVYNSTTPDICFNISDNSVFDHHEVFLKTNKCERILRHVNTFSMCWFDDPTYGKFYLGAYQVMVIVVYNVITEVSILVGMVVILRQLAASRKLRKRMRLHVTRETSIHSKKSTFKSHSAQITRSLLLVNAVFLFCGTPVQIFLLGRTTWIDENTGMTETQEIIWAVFNMMFYINHAVNFILYFLSGSRFRKQVKETLRCTHKRDNLNGSSLSHQENGAMSNGPTDSNSFQHPCNTGSISQF